MFVEIQENVRAARKPLFWTQNQQRIVETLVFTHYVHIFGDMFKLYKWPGLSLMYYLGEKNSKLTCQRDTKRQHINSGLSKLCRTIKSKLFSNLDTFRPGAIVKLGLRSKWYKLLIAVPTPNYLLTKGKQWNLLVINSLVTVEPNIYWVVNLRRILVLTACPAPASQWLWLPQVSAHSSHSPAPGSHCLCLCSRWHRVPASHAHWCLWQSPDVPDTGPCWWWCWWCVDSEDKHARAGGDKGLLHIA